LGIFKPLFSKRGLNGCGQRPLCNCKSELLLGNELSTVNLAIVSSYLLAEALDHATLLLTGEDVTNVEAVAGVLGDTGNVEVAGNDSVNIAEVDVHDNILTVSEVTKEGDLVVLIVDDVRRTSILILVELDEIGILQKLKSSLVHVANVTTDHKSSSENAPDSEVSAVLKIGTAGYSNVTLTVHTADQHVDIVVATGSGVGPLCELAVGEVTEGTEGVVDVTGRTVQVSTGGTDPGFYSFSTPVTSGEHDVTSGSLKSHRHSVVKVTTGYVGLVAVVVLQVVNTPLSKGLRIDELVLIACGIACTGKRTVAGVHTELQSLRVDIVGKSLHSAGELLGISNKSAVCISSGFDEIALFVSLISYGPAVIDYNVLVSCVLKSGGNDSISGLLNEILIDVCTKGVP